MRNTKRMSKNSEGTDHELTKHFSLDKLRMRKRNT